MKIKPIFYMLPLFLAACKNEEEAIPAYIRIEPFAVTAEGGAAWQKITEGWLFVNNKLVGGYSLPATVPVLATGEVQVTILPGVRENGLTLTPSVYPLLKGYEAKVTLTAAEITSITPSTDYFPNAVFPWTNERSSFNVGAVNLENRDSDTSNTYVLTTEDAFDIRSVKMPVDTAHDLMEIATEVVDDIPATEERPVWLELHYRNDVPFEISIVGTDANGGDEAFQPIYVFGISENWNKIYLNLTPFLIGWGKSKYRLFFRTILPQNTQGKYEQLTGAALFDNLRLIHL